MITKFKIFETNEEEINNLLDKMNKNGKDSLTPYELEILGNKGEPLYQEHFTCGDFEFDHELTKEYDDKFVVKGTLTYNGIVFYGSFEYEKDTGQSYWQFFDSNDQEIQLEGDEYEQLNGIMQEVEIVFAN